MIRCKRKLSFFLVKSTLYSALSLFCVVLLSESVGARGMLSQLQIAQQLANNQPKVTRAEAEKLMQEGSQLFEQGSAESLVAAIKKWEAALVLWQKLEDKHWQAATLLSIGRVYSDLGEQQKALEYYNQALPLIRAIRDRGGEAVILNNIGTVYSDLGEKQKALEYYNQALPLRRAVSDRRGEAVTLNNIGLVYSDLGEQQKALEYYNQALPLRREVDDRGGEAVTLNNIGLVYFDIGEKQKALEFFNQALPLRRAVSDRRGEATTLNNIGGLYNSLGESRKAIEYLIQALPLYRKVGDKGGEASTLNNIGGVYSDLGEKEKALELYKRALPLRRKVWDRRGEAESLNNIGNVYSALGENQKALEYLQQALPLRRAVRDRAGEATTLNNIGGVYKDLRENQKALEYYNQALPLLRAVGNRDYEVAIMGNLAELERKQGDLQTSLKYIKSAIKIIEELRGTYTDQDLKTQYFATVQNYYKVYIDLLMELDKKNPGKNYAELAFNISERSRARGLVELLKESNANIRKGVNPELLARERDLLSQINARETLRTRLLSSLNQDDPITKSTISRLAKEIANLRNQSKQVQTKIRTTNPAYALISNPDPDKDILKLPQVQQQLDKDTILLQYSLDQDRSYLWVVTPNSLHSFTLPGREKIENAAEKFRSVSAKDNTSDFLEKASQALSQIILPPEVAKLLPGKRLVLATDGGLQTIPFAALHDPNSQPEKDNQSLSSQDTVGNFLRGFTPDHLVTRLQPSNAILEAPPPVGFEAEPQSLYSLPETRNKENKGQEKAYQPLIINHEIVNLPSITALATQRKEIANRPTAPKTLAVLADPVFNKDKDERLTGKPPTITPELEISQQLEKSALAKAARSLNKRNGWDRLPYTKQEAEELLNLVNNNTQTRQAVGFDATYEWATNPQLKQYRFVHFATHGFADPEKPERSGIVLSLFDEQGKPTEKGYLRLGDIFNLDFAADLVVLSACQTGLGKEMRGEGLMGITRGLMYAGAPRAAVSLWDVNDKGTSVLMQKFYKQMLGENKTPAAALRAAQLEMLQSQDYSSSFYWSGFTLQGEWR